MRANYRFATSDYMGEVWVVVTGGGGACNGREQKITMAAEAKVDARGP